MRTASRFGDNGGASLNYEPNSDVEAPKQGSSYAEPALVLSDTANRHDHRDDADYYSQPGRLFNLMDADQKTLLISNIAGAMAGVSRDVIMRQRQHFYKADAVYGAGVADALSIQQG